MMLLSGHASARTGLDRRAVRPRNGTGSTDLRTLRGRLLALVCCLAVLMVGLDSTALNVALPDMQHPLHTSVSGMQWVIDVYNLVVAALIILAGSAGDRIGRRRIFCLGLLLFGLGSALCALAATLQILIACRVVQALGGVMIAPVSLSVITHSFTDTAQRSRAIGMWSAAFGTGLAVGPLVGGALVAADSWRSIFWINVPIALSTLVLTRRFVPESRSSEVRRTDVLGQLLVVVLLGALTYAIIEAPRRGWSAPPILPCLAAAAVALVAFAVWERTCPQPLVDLHFFRSVPFTGSAVISVASFAALGGYLFVSTLYLQDVRGMSAFAAGLWMLPMPLMTVACAPVAGRLSGSQGPRLPLVLAGGAMASSGLLMVVCHGQDRAVSLCLAYALFGAGIGLVDVPATALAVAGMPRTRAGTASAITMAACRIGVVLGVAIFGAVLSLGLTHGLHPGPGGRLAFTAAFGQAEQPIWWIVTGCGAAVALLGLCVTGTWARATAHRSAVALDTAPAAGHTRT
ncbi:MFS transporter [Streptomyces sp. 769]|uniref:MFS transporter n=1 Tax=Streptomyces sp. 769 TaxID=1262452 RepID=UPI000581C5A9|nr:MFS transporter [Streptomyces sp. 769]AJC53195.1 efflux protein [Streptomyces sp. 769]